MGHEKVFVSSFVFSVLHLRVQSNPLINRISFPYSPLNIFLPPNPGLKLMSPRSLLGFSLCSSTSIASSLQDYC